MAVELFYDRTGEQRQVALDGEAERRLRVREVPVALGKAREELRVELQLGRRVDRIHAVALVDRLAAHDAPAPSALLEEIVEAPRAYRVDLHALHLGALVDGHLGLRDGAAALHLDARAAEEMQDHYAAVERRAAHVDEFVGGALEPGGGHPPAFVPAGAKALPVAGVAPHRPVVDDLDDRQPVLGTHSLLIPAVFTTRAQRSTSSRITFANCSGDPGSGSLLCAANCALTSGLVSTFCSSPFRRAISSRGVPAGACSPDHSAASEPRTPASAMVGTSGSAGDRRGEITPSATALPALTCGIAVEAGVNSSGIWPLKRSAIACELPLYGTWARSMPVLILNSSPFMCTK